MHAQSGSRDSVAACQAAAVARALSILYNNSRIYGIEHPVFQKTLGEHMPFLEDALSETGELVLSFIKGKVRSGPLLLDPGSTVFESLAHMLEGMGVSGLSLRRGITEEEVSKLVTILALRADAVSDSGLQKLLESEGVRHIVEKKVNLAMDGVGKPLAAAPGKAKKTSADPSSPPVTGRTFELDDDTPALSTDFSSPDLVSAGEARPNAVGGRARPFKEFVAEALMDMAGKKDDVSHVAQQISNEFNERLLDETKVLRREKDIAVRRLESVKNVVFEKLEALNVMAILVGDDLRVLAMTSSARFLMGDLDAIPSDMPLALCVKSNAAYMDVNLKGRSLTAHVIASDSSSAGETIVLLTLNPA